MRLRTHHHRDGSRGGRCRHRVRGRVRAAICYSSAYQHLSAKRLAEAMDALFGLPTSTGTVISVLARAHDGVAGFETQVKEHLATAPVAYADESVVGVAGTLYWLHAMCTHLVT
ncbi:transposase [Streptomyces sp. NPDC002680]|uniref:IS66 family transposase n=1 Tax=Streptomyces sp. NPDC002680 TaxID=3364659 RepID=UPI0036A06386